MHRLTDRVNIPPISQLASRYDAREKPLGKKRDAHVIKKERTELIDLPGGKDEKDTKPVLGVFVYVCMFV